jgi:hypothetical protein
VPQYVSGPILINAAPIPQERLDAGGWFLRSFSTTMGIVVAIVAVLGSVSALVCGGCLVISGSILSATRPSTARVDLSSTEIAKKIALPYLSKHGIDELDDSTALVSSPTEIQLVGSSKNTSWGQRIWFKVDFDAEAYSRSGKLELKSVSIDGKVVYDKASESPLKGE